MGFGQRASIGVDTVKKDTVSNDKARNDKVRNDKARNDTMRNDTRKAMPEYVAGKRCELSQILAADSMGKPSALARRLSA